MGQQSPKNIKNGKRMAESGKNLGFGMVLPHWGHVDHAEEISARRPINLVEPQQFCQDQWFQIQPEALPEACGWSLEAPNRGEKGQ